MVTPGAKMAVYLAVRGFINEGDEVLIPAPSWVSYQEIVKAAGGVPVVIDLPDQKNYAITAEILEKYSSPKTKMLIVNSPNNPTGRILNHREIEEIARFVHKKNCILLSDEIYEKIIFDGRKFVSPAAFDELKDQTITVNGFSKAYAMTGWRLGYLAGRKQYLDVINKLYTHTITGTSPFIQKAAVAAFDCNEEVETMRQSYEARRNYFITELNKIPGVSAAMPEGSFYAWVRFRAKQMTSFQIAKHLLDFGGVVGVPGAAYCKSDNQYIRFSFAAEQSKLENAVKRIRKAVKTIL